MDAAWWRRHQQLLTWNDRRGVFLLDEGAADDEAVERARPKPPPHPPHLDEILGQNRVVESLRIALEAARIEGRRPDPILLTGPAGGGKTTITLRLADFVTVAATTDPDRMPRPLRDRFTHQEVLDVYGEDALDLLRLHGRPVGRRRLAGLLGMSVRLFVDAVEPLLLRLGLVHVTPRGLAIAGFADRVAEGGPRISRGFHTQAPRVRYGSFAG